MDGEELDQALGDLERQLERVRALYEQYFMGIEKMEPSVPRKDVDRKFWALKRTQIRNTARRFRLNSLFMRYTTLQQRWNRVSREIENGTYARHVARAERRMGSTASPTGTQEQSAEQEVGRQDKAQAATDAAAEDLAALLDSDLDPVEEAKRAMEAALKPSSASERPARPSLRAAAPKHEQARPSAPLEMDDDDLFGASTPPTKGPSVAPGRGSGPSRPPPLPGRRKGPPGAGRAPTGAGSARPPAVSARPPSVSARPPSVSARPPSVSARPPSASARPPSAKPPPVAAKPRAAAKPPLTRAKPGASAIFGANKTHDPLAGDRVKQLHSKLVAAKKQLNQGGNVSLNGLEKQLRATLPKLQQKHRGRQIDFDVVVKDGRAIVKPKVR